MSDDFRWSGSVFNRLRVLERVEDKVYTSGRKIMISAICECGIIKNYQLASLKSGNTKSCGCLNVEMKLKHGMYYTRQYKCWVDMKNRCDDQLHEGYGSRGISYQESWKSFEGFWQDMEEGYSENLTIDRIDVNKNYTKENCRWASKSTQSRNRRKYSNNTTGITGISRSRDKDGVVSHYIASTQNLQGKTRSKWFSVSKFGEENAFKLACQFREDMIKQLNELGADYAANHGK